MRRRSFLKTVAAVAPAAGLQNFLVTLANAQAATSPPPSAVHVVGAGEDCSGHPHSLGFSSILFRCPNDQHHSCRSVTMGSTLAARRAGM